MDSTTGRSHSAAGILDWRYRRLRRAGVDVQLAEQISRDCALDIQALIALLERGCPPDLAVRIVAP